ncbi:MAG TPA: ERF family protein [Urbifossiella sp.]|nr:ERF family protein [Urbifossiella sp.]
MTEELASPQTPSHSPDIKDLALALSAAQGEMTHAGKGTVNPHFRSKYADLSAVIDALKPALAKHGLAYVQTTDLAADGGIVLVTTLLHKSGQWIRGTYPVRPIKADPQGYGSALTYARRYALAAIAGVASVDEDDDGNAASGHPKPVEPLAKSPFPTSDARRAWVDNVLLSFDNAPTLAKLKDLSALNQPKLDEMWATGEADDRQAVEEVITRYKATAIRLKAAAGDQPTQQGEAP